MISIFFLTLKHILIECVDFNHICPKYLVAASMIKLFEKVDSQNVIDFIKEVYLYHYT